MTATIQAIRGELEHDGHVPGNLYVWNGSAWIPWTGAVTGSVTVAAVALSSYHVVALATTNVASIKGSAGSLYGVSVFNLANYPIYTKFYNKATTPNPASDTPFRTIGVQAGVRADILIGGAQTFSLGIGIAIVKGIADDNNVAVAAGDAVVDVTYV